MITLVYELLILILIGSVGAFIFFIFRIPVPFLLGSMFTIILLKLLEIPIPALPFFLLPIIQILLGLFIGTSFDRKTLGNIYALILPTIMISIWVIVNSLGLSIFLPKVFDVDFFTVLLGVVPGGAPEAGIIALAVGADVPTVMVMQIARLFITIFFVTVIVTYKNKQHSEYSIKQMLKGYIPHYVFPLKETICLKFNKCKLFALSYPWKDLLIGIIVASCGGYLGMISGFPAGLLFGALFLVMAFSISYRKLARPPVVLRNIMHISVGVAIGHTFTPETMANLSFDLFLLVALALGITLIGMLLMVLIVIKITKWDFTTSILATAPVSLTSMIAFADTFNCDSLKVGILHLARIITIKMLIIIVISFL